jgi:hypothetical protein
VERSKKDLGVGTGNPCNEEDMNLFYGDITFTTDNDAKTPFWHAPWLEGRNPKDIAPKKFESCKRKN